jgi:hypothetical protein
MGITSFTLSGLAVDAAASGVKGTVPRPHEPVKSARKDLGPDAGTSWLSRRNHQFLPNQQSIGVGERVFFEDRFLRYAEAGGDPRERVSLPYDIPLLLAGSRDRRRARGRGDNRESRGRLQRRLLGVVLTRCCEQSRRDRETGGSYGARLVVRGQNARRPVARDADSSGHL